MKNYTWLKTFDYIQSPRQSGAYTVDIWIHNDKVIKNRTSWSELELKQITNNFSDMDAINEESEWEDDENGEPIVSVKKDNLMYILIGR